MPSIISILSTFQIIGATTAYTLGLVFYNWVTIFMNTFITPLLSKILNKNINDISINIFNIKFKIGNFLIASIDLILVMLFILFILKIVLNNVVEKIIENKNEHNNKMINFMEDITKWRIPIIQK